MSASSVAANGAGPMPAISMMRKPASGPIVVTFLFRLARSHARNGIAQRPVMPVRVCDAGKRFSMPLWLHAR